MWKRGNGHRSPPPPGCDEPCGAAQGDRPHPAGIVREHDALGPPGTPTGQEDDVRSVGGGLGLIEVVAPDALCASLSRSRPGVTVPRAPVMASGTPRSRAASSACSSMRWITDEEPGSEVGDHLACLGGRMRRIQRGEGSTQARPRQRNTSRERSEMSVHEAMWSPADDAVPTRRGPFGWRPLHVGERHRMRRRARRRCSGESAAARRRSDRRGASPALTSARSRRGLPSSCPPPHGSAVPSPKGERIAPFPVSITIISAGHLRGGRAGRGGGATRRDSGHGQERSTWGPF